MPRILLVDDNEDFRNLLLRILKGAGHEVTCAGDGNEAIRHFRSTPFDLVITDLVMPDKEGLETIIEMRALQPSLRIIAMTGGSVNAATYLQMANSFGVSKTLTKPFSFAALLEAVGFALVSP